MRGIDVSAWQRGINLAEVPADFVIVKATQGTDYISSALEEQYYSASSAARLMGVYHYATGCGVEAEADHFLTVVGGHIGDAILCLDWEAYDNSMWATSGEVAYINAWMDYVKAQTGVQPVLYIQRTAMSRVSAVNAPLWIAQYADMATTGYQDNPWNESTYDCLIRQYSSRGRLSGFDGNLDLNKFYGTKEDWLALAGAKKQETQEDDDTMVYKTYDDVPNSYKASVKKAMTYGYLVGNTNGDLNLTESEARTLTILDRAGALGARYKTIADVPAAYKDTIEKLTEGGLLFGKASDNLDLNEDMARLLTVLDRAGLFN